MTQDDDGGGGDGYGAGARGRSSTPAVPASSPPVRSGKWNEGRSSEEDRDKKGQVWDIDMAARGILCSILRRHISSSSWFGPRKAWFAAQEADCSV
jgi:hypothetical protein